MNTDNLHDILDETVQVYSQKKQSRSETPAEIGAHFHPLLDRLCETAEAQNASDILISKGFPPSLKINSALTPQPQKALTGEETAAIAASTMNAEQSEIFRRDGEINYSVQSRSGTRYRANAYYSQGSAGLVLRRINHVIPQMRELGLPEKLKDLAVAPRGLLIIVGPTGSGKSTTMATMLEHRNKTLPGHIVTIEDPIEFIYKPRRCIFTQREIGVDTINWQTAVQNAMRQSPDDGPKPFRTVPSRHHQLRRSPAPVRFRQQPAIAHPTAQRRQNARTPLRQGQRSQPHFLIRKTQCRLKTASPFSDGMILSAPFMCHTLFTS